MNQEQIEKIKKEALSENARKGYDASIGKKSPEWIKENARRANAIRWGKETKEDNPGVQSC